HPLGHHPNPPHPLLGHRVLSSVLSLGNEFAGGCRDGLRLSSRRYQTSYTTPADTNGRFRAGANSDYRREWILVAGRKPSRRDRLSPRIFKEVLCAVEVETVTRDARQRSLPPGARYSRVARVVE